MLMIMLVLQYFIYIYWSFVFHEESFLIVNPQKTPEKVMPEDVLDEALQERWVCGVGGGSVDRRVGSEDGVRMLGPRKTGWGGWKGVGVSLHRQPPKMDPLEGGPKGQKPEN